MLEEAIQRIALMAQESCEASIVEIPEDPQMVYIAHNGQLHKHPIPQVPDRRHEVQTLGDLATVVIDHGAMVPKDPNDEASAASLATVWHGDGEVVGLLGDRFRKDKVTMKLITSPVFARLGQLENTSNNRLDQRAFLRLLKFDFDKAGDFGDLLANARQLKFSHAADGTATLEQGRESLGKSVLNEVAGLEKFPEEFVVEYPVYVNPDLALVKAAVTVSLEIDVTSEKFIVTPKPDEMLAARQHVHQWIGEKLAELLAEAQVPVYYGKP